jgi:hypothetical protein
LKEEEAKEEYEEEKPRIISRIREERTSSTSKDTP